MKNRKAVLLCVAGGLLFVYLGAVTWLSIWEGEEHDADTESHAFQAGDAPEYQGTNVGSMTFGKFTGDVEYDEENDQYYLLLRGARFPFKSSPLEVQSVPLDVPGETLLEKNTALIQSILGKEVLHTTLLINPDEEDEVAPAFADIARYMQMVNRRKYAGIAYTKEGGKLENSVMRGPQIQALENATSKNPIIQIKGPKSGADKTRISLNGDGKIIVEGETYRDLYKAADLIGITLLKMLCGSPDCPDAAECVAGGDCGCP